MPAVAGAILAGGRSQRFRGDKLRLRLPGEDRDLATRAAESVRDLGLRPCWWLSPHAPAVLPSMVEHLTDPGEGPKAALACALEAVRSTPARAALLVGADLPLVRGRHLERLLSAWEKSSQERALFARDAEGRPQPVFAIYPGSWLTRTSRQLARGDRALFSLVKQAEEDVLNPSEVTVSVTDPHEGRDTIHPCFNLNQDQDWEQLLEWSKEGKLQ